MQIEFRNLLRFIFIIFISFVIVIISLMLVSSSAFASELNSDVEQQVLQIIRKHPEVILESIQGYQQQQQEKEKQERLSLLRSIKTNRKQFIGNSPTLGRKNSKEILIEFADFQCPYCADVHTTLKQFVANHKDGVALVYKHYPLAQIHSEAMTAATAAWAAHRQDKFWQFHDFLFAHQDRLKESLYLQAAKDLGLDLTQFERDRKSQDAITAVQKDMELAEKLGISGTPFFVMNEEIFSGAIQESFLENMLVRM